MFQIFVRSTLALSSTVIISWMLLSYRIQRKIDLLDGVKPPQNFFEETMSGPQSIIDKIISLPESKKMQAFRETAEYFDPGLKAARLNLAIKEKESFVEQMNLMKSAHDDLMQMVEDSGFHVKETNILNNDFSTWASTPSDIKEKTIGELATKMSLDIDVLNMQSLSYCMSLRSDQDENNKYTISQVGQICAEKLGYLVE